MMLFYISYPFIEPGDSTSKLLACIKKVIFQTPALTLSILSFCLVNPGKLRWYLRLIH